MISESSHNSNGGNLGFMNSGMIGSQQGISGNNMSQGSGPSGGMNGGNKGKRNQQRDEIKQVFDNIFGATNRLEFQQQKQFKRDVYKFLDLDSFMARSNESEIKYFLNQLGKLIKTNRIHYDILLEIMVKMAVQGSLMDSLSIKEIETPFFQCFGDLNNSNSFVDKKVKCKIFYDQTHESIYDQFFEILAPHNEKNCLKYLIFFRKVCRGMQEIEEDGLSVIQLVKKASERHIFSANCLDIQVILFMSKLWWMMTQTYGVVEERGKSMKAEYDALKVLMSQHKKQLCLILDKMYAYVQAELRNNNKKDIVFFGIIFFILFMLCKIKNVLNTQIENPAFIQFIRFFLVPDAFSFIIAPLKQHLVCFNDETMMLKKYRRCIAEKITLGEALEKLIYNVISNSLINNSETFFKLMEILDESGAKSEEITKFSTGIKNKLLFQSLLDMHPINPISSQTQAVKKTQEFFAELMRRKISINSCYSTYYMQQLRNRNDIFEFVRQILLHPKESLSHSFIDTLNFIKLLSPQFLKIAEKVAKTLKNEEEISFFVFNMQSLNRYLRGKLAENLQYQDLLQFIQFKDLLMMLSNVLFQQYELVQENRKNSILKQIIIILDIMQEYCLEDIDSYQYVRADMQVSCEFIRLITRFLILSCPLHRQNVIQYVLIIITSTCLFSQKRIMTLFLELQEQIIGFSIQNHLKGYEDSILFSEKDEFTSTSFDFIGELNIGIDLSLKLRKSRLNLSQKEALALFLYKFFLKQNSKTSKFLSEHSEKIKSELFPKIKDEDIKNNCSLSRKITEVFLFGFKYEKSVASYTNYQRPFYSNHPFDEFVREFVIENKFFYSIIYLTCLKADSTSLNEFFMSMMLNLAAMFHNTQFEVKPHWTLRKTFKTLIKRDIIPGTTLVLVKYFQKMKNMTIQNIIYLFHDFCMKFKTYQNKNCSNIESRDKMPFKLQLKAILMKELKVIAEDYTQIMSIFE